MNPARDQNQSMKGEAARRQACVCGSLRRASRLITQIYDEFLQPAGLKVSQLMMLLAIKRKEPVTISNLAQEMILDRTTCTRNLKTLKGKSLINTVQAKDKRMKQVTLTVHGNEILNKAGPLWEKAQDFMFSQLGEEHTTTLLQELTRAVSLIRK